MSIFNSPGRKAKTVCGAGERSRTLDLLITNELLYQLSYTGFVRGIVRISTGMSTNGQGGA